MKPQTKLTLALITAYSLFMLWWFLREEAPKPGAKPAAVSMAAEVKKYAVVVAATLPSSMSCSSLR